MGTEVRADGAVKDLNTQTEMVVSRQMQEVQGMMILAKKFPRDTQKAMANILEGCKRKGLAEQAEYTYPRGDKKVSGATIRLAEDIARNWGNIDYGIVELSNKDGKSDLMAYAWDLETNARVTKVFCVEHKRDTKRGSYKVTDSRDIYEITANFGTRRLRACILGIIPGDVVDSAVEECRKTIATSHKTPLADRVKMMVEQFKRDFSVSQEQIEKYLGCKTIAITENEMAKMVGVCRSINDGMADVKDYFDDGKPTAESSQTVKDAFKKTTEEPPKDQTPPARDQVVWDKLKATYPGEEEWKIQARYDEIKGIVK